MTPYYSDSLVSLYLGDCRVVLPALGVTADCIIADPPYGETSLEWDRWPDGWLDVAATVTRSLWCFGSLRLFMQRRDEFAAHWNFSQEIVWEKHNGSGLRNDRFRRVHEQVAHWYRGAWRDVYHEVPREASAGKRADHFAVRGKPVHMANGGAARFTKGYEDDGTRLAPSVVRVANLWKRGAIHPTEKPVGLLDLLIEYACPMGGLVIDPFAGSGSTLDAARCAGRRAVGIELHEPYAEAAAKRLSQMFLEAS
jgi:site-specific DNA-methyltransferase (adenine-specific)